MTVSTHTRTHTHTGRGALGTRPVLTPSRLLHTYPACAHYPTSAHSTQQFSRNPPLLLSIEATEKQVRCLLSCLPRSLVRWLPRSPAAPGGRCDANVVHPIGRRRLQLSPPPFCLSAHFPSRIQHLRLLKSVAINGMLHSRSHSRRTSLCNSDPTHIAVSIATCLGWRAAASQAEEKG